MLCGPPRQEANKDDPEVATQVLAALTALANHPSAIPAMISAGVPQMAIAWLDANLGHCTSEQTERALKLLAMIAQTPEGAAAVRDGGGVGVVISALDVHCSSEEDEDVDLKVMAAAIAVAVNMGDSDEALRWLQANGVHRKMMKCLAVNDAYMDHDPTITPALDFIERSVRVPGLNADLCSDGVVNWTLKTMHINRHADGITEKGGLILASTVQPDQLGIKIGRVKGLIAKFEQGDMSGVEKTKNYEAIARELADINNLMLVSGAVTADNAADMTNTVSAVLSRAQNENEEDKSAASEECLALSLEALGRIAAINAQQGLQADNTQAIRTVMVVARSNDDNIPVLTACIQALGDLGSTNHQALATLKEEGGMDLIQLWAGKNLPNEEIDEVARQALAKVSAGMMLAAQQEGGPEAIGLLLAANKDDPAKLGAVCATLLDDDDDGENQAALLAIAASTDDPAVAEAIIRVLEKQAAEGARIKVGSEAEGLAIVKALNRMDKATHDDHTRAVQLLAAMAAERPELFGHQARHMLNVSSGAVKFSMRL